MYPNSHCRLQAHRGVSTDAPENTMAAFREAIRQGYDIIELDPKFTKDGVCVILHDGTLDRTGRICGRRSEGVSRRIADTSYAELAEIDVGEWFAPCFAGERIPSLAQVLDLAREAGIEMKLDGCVREFTEEQIESLFSTVETHGDLRRVGLTSPVLPLLRRYAERFPAAPLHYDGPVSHAVLDELETFASGHPTTVWMRMDNRLTSWCKTPPITETLSALIKQRFSLGLWILGEDCEMAEALRFDPDVVETTGGIKPS